MKVEEKSGSKRTLSLQAGMFVLAQSAALLLVGLLIAGAGLNEPADAGLACAYGWDGLLMGRFGC